MDGLLEGKSITFYAPITSSTYLPFLYPHRYSIQLLGEIPNTLN